MNQQVHFHDAEVIDQAMSAYLLDAAVAKNKTKKIKVNMECRRKLEIKWEEMRLQREISEYSFGV